MRTLFLGSFGYGNLGDEACLLEALHHFPTAAAHVCSADPVFTAASVPGLCGFIRERREIAALRPQRVVIGGGGIGFMPSIRDVLHWAADAQGLGAEIHLHNIGVALMQDLAWLAAPEVQRVLRGLSSCSVRDDLSCFCMRLWPGAPVPRITRYPERMLPPDATLLSRLPAGRRLLGISITGQAAMRNALKQDGARVHRWLQDYAGCTVVPIISTVIPGAAEEDDIAGFRHFAAGFLPGFDICCPEFLDPGWWRGNMTALRLKAIIGALDMLLTQRKHNLLHAIGAGVATTGIHPAADDSIARVFYTLRDELAHGSGQLALRC